MAMVEVRLQDGSAVSVSYPRVPPAPNIGPQRREDIAREWLVSLSQAPSPERVEALAPWVGRFAPQSPLGKIASQFVSGNRVPVHEDVIAEYLRRQAVRRRVSNGPIAPDSAAQVLEVIDQQWAQHGRGPAWSQLGKRVGLDRRGVAVVLRDLKKTGAITFTDAPGSLRRTTAPDHL